MATYGRKRHSFLPSFNILRDSDSATRSKKDKSAARGSTITLSAFHDIQSKGQRISHHDDSIEEMASILLDDTTIDQLRADPGRRLSQIPVPNELTNASPRMSTYNDKALPQLPNLVFNGDDAWALKSTSVVTAIGNSNEMQFTSARDELQSYPPSIAKRQSNHIRKTSAPPIPRKSSKRRSVRNKSVLSSPKRAAICQSVSGSAHRLTTSISTPNYLNAPGTKSSNGIDPSDINGKIKAMLEASAQLKPSSSSGTLLQGPLVANKKRRFKDHKVLAKVKTAINDRLGARQIKKAHDSARDDRLLDLGINDIQDLPDLPDLDEEISHSFSALNTLEIRLNEGKNLAGHIKLQRITGHGNISRKPIADEGRSLRSRKSFDDPFSERPCSSQRRTPRPRDDKSLEIVRETVPEALPLPRSYTELPAMKKMVHSTTGYETDFDLLLSSSPDAQSTPRIRLEPSYEENGRKTLKQVPADTRSVFDSDKSLIAYTVEADALLANDQNTDTSALDPIKRKSSQLRNSKLEVQPVHTKRMKKHPSPSKADLEKFEQMFLRDYPDLLQSDELGNAEVVPTALSDAAIIPILAPLDSNQRMVELHRPEKGQTSEVSETVNLTRAASSTPEFSRRPRHSRFSLMPKMAGKMTNQSRPKRESYQHPVRKDHDRGSDDDMDIDELQADASAYNIGMKRV
ncbi:hypothetical protein BGZ60DRAFT_523225 [Tricladium varicosporioides]|nr:hypothetical protein BGZ60DRAFT_523225 [Hymenoscyphus varicosporioides]